MEIKINFMFRYLFLITLFFSVNTFGQGIEGFMGIKFGTSIDVVKKTMLSKPGCTLDNKYSDTNHLVFDGIKFAGRETLFIRFEFVDKKFHTATAFFKPNLSSKTIDLYNEIKSEINEKYYITEEDFEIYRSPYEKGDGYTESAIRLGKASFSAFWKYKNTNTTEDVNNYIALEINENLNIELSYQDGVLVKISSQRKKAKNNTDY